MPSNIVWYWHCRLFGLFEAFSYKCVLVLGILKDVVTNSGTKMPLCSVHAQAVDFLDKLLRYDHQDRLTAREAMVGFLG